MPASIATDNQQTSFEDEFQSVLEYLENPSDNNLSAVDGLVVATATQAAQTFLTQLATSDRFMSVLQEAFGDRLDLGAAESLRQQWTNHDFSTLPALELRSTADLSGALGAFSKDTQTIYLSKDYLHQRSTTASAVTNILLEEIGHAIESKLSNTDAPGDEGSLFSKLIWQQTLSPLQLEFLKSENDNSILFLDGKQVSLEQATAYEGTNLADIKLGLSNLLTSLQGAVNNQVFSNSLPLVGDSLKNSANDALQFISKLKTELDNKLATLPDTATVEDLEAALEDAATDLGIFKDLQRVIDTADNLVFSLDLGQTPVNFSTPLQSNIGLPNLGLRVNGNANAEFGYNFKLNFGLNKTDGFFVDTSVVDPLKLDLDITTPGLDPKLNLGFLQFNATDKGTKFDSEFSVKLKDLNTDNKLFLSELTTIGTNYAQLVDARLKGSADVELGLGASTGVKGLPAIGTDFSLKWSFSDSALLDPTNPGSFGGIPEIKFSNTVLDLGSLVSDFVGPILTDIKKVTGPLADVAGELTDPLPVIGASLIQLAPYAIQAFGGSSAGLEFIEQLLKVIKLADEVSDIATSDGLKIDLGDFNLGSADVRLMPTSSATANPTRSTDPTAQLTTAAAGGSEAASFIQQLQNAEASKEAPTLKFNLLDDPSSYAFGLLLGKDVGDILTFTPPELSLYFKFSPPSIPVFGPVVLKFEGIAGAGAGIKVGYDTKGLADFAKGADNTLGTADDFSNPAAIFDGFYASKPDSLLPTDPLIKPKDFLSSPFAPTGHNLSLLGELNASAGVGIGIADITVGGGLRFTSNLDLVGKVRASTIASTNPLCLFEPNGKLSAVIFGQIELDFGFFSFTERIDLANIDLIDYSTGCDPSEPHYKVADPDPDPETQQQLAAQGIIDRKGTDSNDTITFIKSGGGKGDETLTLVGLVPKTGETNFYEHVKLVVINGAEGNDTIDLTGILAPGQLKGGVGNDTLIGSDGGSNFLIGGAGNDNLRGGTGTNNTVDYSSSPRGVNAQQGYANSNGGGVFVNLLSGVALDGFGGTDSLNNIQNAIGSAGNDTLIASNTTAYLNGGEGDDILEGGNANDVLLGGLGADDLDGGGGTNTTTYITSRAAVYVNLSNTDIIDGSISLPVDFSPLYLEALAGSGGDAEGDRLTNIQNIQGSLFDDILLAGDASTLKSANGFSFTGSYIDGSDGDDIIYSGSGSDVLDGGRGTNWLSYALSNAGVNVSLKPIEFFGTFFTPTGSGGYAQGDRILPAKNQYNDNKGTFTNLSSFRNLEGSNGTDTLGGDDGDNVIRGLAGNDAIDGEGGNDILIGGVGADSLTGGGFSSTLRALLSADAAAFGGLGGDTASYVDSQGAVFVNLGANLGLLNDAAGDTFNGIQNLIGSNYADFLIGDAQDNDLNPGLSRGGTDFVSGGEGTNSLTLDYSLGDYGQGMTGGFTNLSTGAGSFSRLSSDGSKTLDAVSFNNIQRLYITATSRNDIITGGIDNLGDVIFAQAGDDFVDGGSGIDYLDGGDNIDTLSQDLSAKFGLGNITLYGTDPLAPTQFSGTNVSLSDGTRIANFEIFKDIRTSNGNDVLYQPGRVDNTFSTATGDDIVNPGIGFDTVDGGTSAFGSFFIPENDLLVLDYSQGDSGGRMRMFVNPLEKTGLAFRYTTDLFLGEIAPPLLDRVNFSNFEHYSVTGTTKDDWIETGDGNDVLAGIAGNDNLFGNRGNDYLFGGEGDDTLQGSNNSDYGYDIPPDPDDYFQIPTHVYDLANDIDVLTGGVGADAFVLGAGSETSYINQVFYAKAVNSYQQIANSGSSDYALITDFNPTEGDTIRLHDMRPCNGYSLGATPADVPSGTGLFFNQDLIAVIQGPFSAPLDLNASYFQYVGLPCPPPVIIG